MTFAIHSIKNLIINNMAQQQPWDYMRNLQERNTKITRMLLIVGGLLAVVVIDYILYTPDSSSLFQEQHILAVIVGLMGI